MGWFDGKTSCYKCGKEIDKKTAEKRFGKPFCSVDHAEEFAKQVEKQRAEIPKQKGGGCC